MNLTLSVSFDDGSSDGLGSFMDGIVRRASRAMVLPILQRNLEPVVQAEKSNLSGHNKSGALATSLASRVGGKADRPGTMSAFSSPAATPSVLRSTWGRGRSQQQTWFSRVKPRGGRRRIFYADFVHQGHDIVRRDASGESHVVGHADPIPFALDALLSLGDQQIERAASEILDMILGE